MLKWEQKLIQNGKLKIDPSRLLVSQQRAIDSEDVYLRCYDLKDDMNKQYMFRRKEYYMYISDESKYR